MEFGEHKVLIRFTPSTDGDKVLATPEDIIL
jgi:hypothetical protein